MPELFFDADDTKANRETEVQVLEGNVVAIIGSMLVTADRLVFDRKHHNFRAEGHVFLMNQQVVLMGESVQYDFQSTDFDLKGGMLLVNDPKSAGEIAQRLLGYSPTELLFGANREARLQEVKRAKNKIRSEYRLLASPERKSALIDQYAILLERESLMRAQEFPRFQQSDIERRDTFLRRRAYWETSQARAVLLGSNLDSRGFMKIMGQSMTRRNGNDYKAEEAFLTPCFCEEDESPVWGFRTRRLRMNMEGYAELQNPVFEIKGVPVLYLPFLKIPMKEKRQSGFLLPSVSHNQTNGTIFSQPVYVTLGENADSTFNFDTIQTRGARFGAELRYQQRQYAGWEVKGEVMRDRLWSEQIARRELVSQVYQDGLASAQADYAAYPTRSIGKPPSPLTSKDWWLRHDLALCLETDSNCAHDVVDRAIGAPSNRYRGSFDWRGQSFVAPRLSLVSAGGFLSDHRYTQDLYSKTLDASLTLASPKLLSKAKGQIHLDGPDFYIGLGSRFADQMKMDEYFGGYQMPLNLNVRTRLIPLSPTSFPLPVYAMMSMDMRRIDIIREPNFVEQNPPDSSLLTLGGGLWLGGMLRLTSPIVSDQAIVVDHFTEFEGRYINSAVQVSRPQTQTQVKEGTTSETFGNHATTIKTFRTGFNFNLPLDGSWVVGEETNPETLVTTKTVLTHRMNWGMTLSLRPVVVRRGRYGEDVSKVQYDPLKKSYSAASGYNYLAYFDSDTEDPIGSSYVPEAQKMVPHRLISFGTSHDWYWGKTDRAQLAPDFEVDGDASYRERARKELMASVDQVARSSEALNSDTGPRTNRYQVADAGAAHPLHFDSGISYDFLKEPKRREFLADPVRKNGDLPEPWSPWSSSASVTFFDWNLSAHGEYNLYKKITQTLGLRLTPPTVFSTTLTLGLDIEKNIRTTPKGDFVTDQMRTRSYGISSTWIPHITTSLQYAVKTTYNTQPSEQKQIIAAMNYASPSNCWGTKFYWLRDYSDVDWAGTYYLAVVVRFFNYDREYGNFGSRYNKLEG